MALRRPPAPRPHRLATSAPDVPVADPAPSAPVGCPAPRPGRVARGTGGRRAEPRRADGRRSGPRRRPVLLAAAGLAAATVPAAGAALLLGRGGTGEGAPGRALPARSSEVPAAEASDAFPDVAADDPGLDAMVWSAEHGVLTAGDDGRFDPTGTVDRGTLFLALHRFAGAPELSVDDAPTLLTDLGDDTDLRRAMLWLQGRGALYGDDAFAVHPSAPTSRDGAGTLLTALLRPALAGVGSTWDADAATVGDASGSPHVGGLSWLHAAGMLPAELDLAALDDEAPVTRAELAQVLAAADRVISGVVD